MLFRKELKALKINILFPFLIKSFKTFLYFGICSIRLTMCQWVKYFYIQCICSHIYIIQVQWRIQDLKKGGAPRVLVHFSKFRGLFKVFSENKRRARPPPPWICHCGIHVYMYISIIPEMLCISDNTQLVRNLHLPGCRVVQKSHQRWVAYTASSF